MNRYDFTLKGIATRKLSIEAESADEAFAYMNNMIRKTSIADFQANEIDEMNVYIERAIDANGEPIEKEIINAEIDRADDDELCDGIYVCPHCMMKGD